MARITDEQKLLLALSEGDNRSNAAVYTEVEWDKEKFMSIKQNLIDKGLVENYKCRGGGVRITSAGSKSISELLKLRGFNAGKSSCSKESDLYKPFSSMLSETSIEDGIDSVVCITAEDKKKGKWQNPDVIKIDIVKYNFLPKKIDAVVTTYELKMWGGWNVQAVFEAASHKRFAHKSYLVLEWNKKTKDLTNKISLSDKSLFMDQISRECQRFGIGLIVMEPYYSQFKLRELIEPVSHEPEDNDVDEFMTETLGKHSDECRLYEGILRKNNS